MALTDPLNPVSSPFALMQICADLSAVAAAMTDATLQQILRRIPGSPEPDMLSGAVSSGRLDGPERATLQPALALAATLPEEGKEGFAGATALLLHDLLRGAPQDETLYWHYEAHRHTYLTLPDPERAALMRGFAALHAGGITTLEKPPVPKEWQRYAEGYVALGFAEDAFPDGSITAQARAALETAIGGNGAEGAERTWEQNASALLRAPTGQRGPLIAGFRHLHDAVPDWRPYRHWSEERLEAEGIVIPFAED